MTKDVTLSDLKALHQRTDDAVRREDAGCAIGLLYQLAMDTATLIRVQGASLKEDVKQNLCEVLLDRMAKARKMPGELDEGDLYVRTEAFDIVLAIIKDDCPALLPDLKKIMGMGMPGHKPASGMGM